MTAFEYTMTNATTGEPIEGAGAIVAPTFSRDKVLGACAMRRRLCERRCSRATDAVYADEFSGRVHSGFERIHEFGTNGERHGL
jgi:hypothetical protein